MALSLWESGAVRQTGWYLCSCHSYIPLSLSSSNCFFKLNVSLHHWFSFIWINISSNSYGPGNSGWCWWMKWRNEEGDLQQVNKRTPLEVMIMIHGGRSWSLKCIFILSVQDQLYLSVLLCASQGGHKEPFVNSAQHLFSFVVGSVSPWKFFRVYK